MRWIASFAGNEDGATAIEYGMIAALIAVAAIVGMMAAGSSVQAVFNYSSNKATAVWDNASTTP